jgi:hypothetical protein
MPYYKEWCPEPVVDNIPLYNIDGHPITLAKAMELSRQGRRYFKWIEIKDGQTATLALLYPEQYEGPSTVELMTFMRRIAKKLLPGVKKIIRRKLKDEQGQFRKDGHQAAGYGKLETGKAWVEDVTYLDYRYQGVLRPTTEKGV